MAKAQTTHAELPTPSVRTQPETRIVEITKRGLEAQLAGSALDTFNHLLNAYVPSLAAKLNRQNNSIQTDFVKDV